MAKLAADRKARWQEWRKELQLTMIDSEV